MCVVSMVSDHYSPLIPFPTWPGESPTPTAVPIGMLPLSVVISQEEVDRLRALIKDFKEAMEAAAKVDRLTGQPDCVDPEKKKLTERVAALELQLKAFKAKDAPKRKRAVKAR